MSEQVDIAKIRAGETLLVLGVGYEIQYRFDGHYFGISCMRAVACALPRLASQPGDVSKQISVRVAYSRPINPELLLVV